MKDHHDFLNPTCVPSKLDIYGARRGSLKALTEQLPNFHGTLLDIGCGRMPYKSMILAPPSRVEKYVGMDLRSDLRFIAYKQFGPPDLEWGGETIPLEANSVDCAICTEVYQQCPDIGAVMRETARVLKPSGLLYFTSPFLWPLHDKAYDLCRPTPHFLDCLLREAGFEDIQMKSRGGWDASLASMIALWVRRRALSRWKRAVLSVLATPVVRFLTDHDRPPPVFTDQTMITGIAGTARKPAALNPGKRC
jgi:SAM-dependent methyltransferase